MQRPPQGATARTAGWRDHSPDELRRQRGEAGAIAFRAPEALRQSEPDRIGDNRENDRIVYPLTLGMP
jgi:hypothetical protein